LKWGWELFKRTVASLITVLLLVGSFVFLLQIHHANAAGTIYIRADGTIDPPTAPVQREGDLYTLIGDVVSDTRGIYIEGRSNMELNGAGHTSS
jgi:hypothetical protein